ncbi:alpha/beta fold hydrolase [Acrocarpospora pleiomorpha]|nr:alpha/beta hydrolase [Acrocarpospora pleiomorpha]
MTTSRRSACEAEMVEVVGDRGRRVLGGALAKQDAGAESCGEGEQDGGLGAGVSVRGQDSVAALLSPPELMKPIMMGYRTFGPTRPPARPFTDEELRAVSVPAFVLLAGRSALLDVSTARRRIQNLIPGAQVDILPKAGHGLPLEVPDLVNQHILRFIDAQTPDAQIPASEQHQVDL